MKIKIAGIILTVFIHSSLIYSETDVFSEMHKQLEKMQDVLRTHLMMPNKDKKFLKDTFIGAVRCNHQKTVELFLQFPSIVNIEWADDQGLTALMHASSLGHENIVQLLIQRNANVNATTANEGGLTVLNCACFNGHLNIVNILLKNGAKINQINKLGCTVLSMLALNGDLNMMEHLIRNGADINCPRSITPLMSAVYIGNKIVVDYLLQNKADIHAVDEKDRPGIFYAIQGKNKNIVKYLIELGVDIHREDANGATPLLYCLFTEDLDILSLLIEHNVDINHQSTRGFFLGTTPLHIAVNGNDSEIVELLIQKGAHMVATEQPNASLLAIAISNRLATKPVIKKIIKILLTNASQNILDLAKNIDSNKVLLTDPINLNIFHEVMQELGMGINCEVEAVAQIAEKKEKTNEKEAIKEAHASNSLRNAFRGSMFAIIGGVLVLGGYYLHTTLNKY